MQEPSSDVQSKIDDAVRHHQAGRLNEAEGIYRQILAMDPGHADSLHLLGLIAYQMGRHELCVDLLKKAIAVRPEEALYHSNLGLAHKVQGNLDQAVACYRRAIDLAPDFARAYDNLGTALWGQGKLAEAEVSYRQALVLRPNDAETHNNLGITLYGQGKLDEAVSSYRSALVLRPDHAETHINLGTALYEQGKLDNAVSCYRAAIAFEPGHAQAHNNLGNALKGLEKPGEAEASYGRALMLQPGSAEAHNNLGTVFWEQGKPGEAIVCYRRALALSPDKVEAHNNLGNALYEQGELDEAAVVYRRILEIKPEHTDALDGLAAVMTRQGNLAAALDTIRQSLRCKETGKSKAIFVDIVKRLRWTNDNSEIRIALARALTEPWVRPEQLARASADLIKLNPDIGECVARAERAWPQRLDAPALLGPIGIQALADDQLLCALLGSTQNTDIAIEYFLTMMRRVMLEVAVGMTARGDGVASGLVFYGALARQCFINEYVFSHTADEILQAGNLRELLNAALEDKTQIPALWLLAVAAYFPLCSLPFAARVLDMPWPEPIYAVLVQQLREPEEEAQLRITIPQVTRIKNSVSRSVQNQYEENPYPRWVRTAPVDAAKSVFGYLRQKMPSAAFQRQNESGIAEVLIAGCGTGQHSIEMAQSVASRVLAVDLSLASLCYAKRKTLELGLASIEYAQADILELGSTGPRFDVIECAGVLHHLADPFAGWRILLSLLRPGGFMMLGLYSELARRNVEKARRFIAERGYGTTADEIRRCRQDFLTSDMGKNFGIVNASDFFGISTCRDFLFHSREHPVTLTDINAYLRCNSLTFLGFEIEADILQAYRQCFPDDPAATNLDHWQAFENDNPDMFSGMYSFWIQKTI